ncbi:hypothetical protein NHX12_017919, partial [Muraenolepis orangiensis]
MRFKPAKSRSMVLRKGKVVDMFRFNIADTAIPSISEKPVMSLGKVFDCSLRDTTSIQSTCTELDGWLKSVDKYCPSRHRMRLRCLMPTIDKMPESIRVSGKCTNKDEYVDSIKVLSQPALFPCQGSLSGHRRWTKALVVRANRGYRPFFPPATRLPISDPRQPVAPGDVFLGVGVAGFTSQFIPGARCVCHKTVRYTAENITDFQVIEKGPSCATIQVIITLDNPDNSTEGLCLNPAGRLAKAFIICWNKEINFALRISEVATVTRGKSELGFGPGRSVVYRVWEEIPALLPLPPRLFQLPLLLPMCFKHTSVGCQTGWG